MASNNSTSASSESRAIRFHFVSLAKAITDPLGLSMELFSKEIIEEVTMEKVKLPNQTDREKSSSLLSAVMKRVEARPSLFHSFVDLVKENNDDILRELGVKLEITNKQCVEQSTSDAKEQTHSTTNDPSTEQYASPSLPPTKQIKLSLPPLAQQIDCPPPPLINPAHPSLLPPPPQSPVCRYANYLRAFYQTSELPTYNKWPRTPSTTFINLAVISREEVSSKNLEKFMLATLHGGIDQILHVKAPIQIEEILTTKPGKTLQCVLVEGAPGVGKTTLAWEVCKQWGKGKLFQQFAVVILVRLRDQRVQNAQSICDLISYQYHREEISQHFIQTDGRDVLIILEGLDELPSHLLMQSSIFTRLLSGEELPLAIILITSRPSATAHIWKNWELRVSRHIEVLGFTQDNISQYIASVLSPQQLPDFQYYLSMNTHIETTMYIPLHAAIVIEVYRWCQHPRRPLPKTTTQLYTCLVNIILQRYLDSHPDYKGKEIQLQTVTDLPPPIYAHFCSLIELAYKGVMEQKLIFYDQDRPIQHLGFMDAVTELFSNFNNKQVSYSYSFLHLSIQEYLAAYYVSTLELHQQEQLLETMCTQTHLQNMAKFLVGITHFKDMDSAIVKNLIEGKSKNRNKEKKKEELKEEKEEEEEKVIRLSPLALQLLYECGDASILGSNQSYVSELDDHSPQFDFSSLGYCIAYSNCKWRLQLGELFQEMKTTEGIEILVKEINNHSNPSHTYKVESIVCWFDAPECVKQLLTGMPQNVVLQLQTLKLESEQQQSLPQCVPELIPTMSSLQTLHLYNAMGAIAMHKIVQAVVNANTLEKLILSYCDINCECITALCQLLPTSSQLKTLSITLPSPNAIEMISTALTTNSTLKTLRLRGSKFNFSAMQVMCCMLTHNNTITEVRLQYCDIDDDIISCLARTLSSNNTLNTLDISWNLIGDGGAKSIAQALHSNNILTTLDISWNSISDRGAVYMAKMLKINNTLQEMDISMNDISNEGLITFQEANKYIKLEYTPQKK